MISEKYARECLADYCHLLYTRNLTVSAGGNMSIRIDDDKVLITPSGVNKGLLQPEDLVLIDMKGKPLSKGKPSIEHKFHLALYKANSNVNAVIHCHPLYCLAVATKGDGIKSTLTPEGVLLLDKVPTVRYETPGSDALVKAVQEHQKSPAMILAKHGAITQGENLEEAFNRMEELEFQAHLQIILGDEAKPLPESEIKILRRMRH